MARPLRIQAPGLIYHVTARGNAKMVIFEDTIDRRTFLRRSGLAEPESSRLTFEDIELDEDAHEVSRGGNNVELTATEYRLLRYLMLNPRRVLTRSQLLEHVWEYDFGGDARVLETYVSYLRKKLDVHGPPLIHTVRGVGYMLSDRSS